VGHRRFDEREPSRLSVSLNPAVEAGSPTGMASAAVAADGDESQKGVLVAIDAHFDQRLGLAGCVSLAPQGAARARPIMDDPCRQRLLQSGLVHMRNHQHVAARRVDRHTSRQAIGAEFRFERLTFFPIACRAGPGFRFDALVHPRLSSRCVLLGLS
jgi:hypothetical protein